jgi:phosphoglycerate dehydrogenase-like enzyme
LQLHCSQVVVDYKQFLECFDRTVKLFPHSGNITKQKASAKCTREVVDAVKKIMQNEPKTFRYLSQQVNFSVETCRTLLKKDLY